MRTDKGGQMKQRHADQMREENDISYEEAIRFAATERITYVAAVRTLVERKRARDARRPDAR